MRVLQHDVAVTEPSHPQRLTWAGESLLPGLCPQLSLCSRGCRSLHSRGATCPTCSFGQPRAGGPLSCPAYRLYWHRWGPSPYFSKKSSVWHRLPKALISVVFSLCFIYLCYLFPKGEGFILSVLMQQPWVTTFYLPLSDVLPWLRKAAQPRPFLCAECFFSSCDPWWLSPPNDTQMEVPCCQANQC